MKKTILSIALVASLISTLSSCMVEQKRDRHYHRNRGRYHGPYDNNGYRRH